MPGNYFDQFDDPAADAKRQQTILQPAQTQGSIRSADVSADTGSAKLPYVAPQAATDLTRSQQGTKLDRYEAIDKLRGQFEKSQEYQRYSASIPALASALQTSGDPEGDIALTYYAAKLFDPDSAVREGEQQMLGQAGSTLDRVRARISKEFGLEDGGTYTPENRAKLRAELIKRAASLNSAYNAKRVQYRDISQRRGFDPYEVIGQHVGASQMDVLKAYDAQQGKGRVGSRTVGDRAGVADAFGGGVPEGAAVGGEPIKGYRLSPDAEKDLLGYVNGGQFTPEGYAQRFSQLAEADGIPVDDAFRAHALTFGKSIQPDVAKGVRFGGVDYSGVDKAATANAGLLESAGQALENLPESFYNVGTGLLAPVADALKSAEAGTPEGIYKTLPQLAGGLLSKAGVANFDEGTANAFADVLKQRYGSLEGVKQALITDPAGVAGDASMLLTAGGSAAARAPGVVGRLGEAVATTGKLLDPISLALGGATEAAPAALSKTPDLVQDAIKAAPAGLVGLPSGLGGDAVSEAFKAGRSRGAAGAPTPQSTAFTEAMREPHSKMEEIVTAARGALGELRGQASAKYEAAMQQFGKNPTPLNLDEVRQRIEDVRPKNYDSLVGARNRPTEHLAWEQMRDLVDTYAHEASVDPKWAMPLAVDQFKQDLYSVGSKIGGAYDNDAERIAKAAYDGVKDLLVKHDPIYADTMADYEKTAREVQQMEDSFSLRAARGKQPNIDTATRKLQSIFRNNAYSNYGQRLAQGERMADLDPTGTLMPLLAGQTASTWRPRSLAGNLGSGAVGTGVLFGANPAMLAATPAFSPRVIGEMAYGAGRAYGAGENALGSVLKPAGQALDAMYAKYNDNPGTALAVARGANYEDAVRQRKEEAERDILARYRLKLPGLDDEALASIGSRY